MKLVIALCLAQIAFTAYAAELAREYPARPVRLINPFPPGGSSDPSCRLLADALTSSLGQQFVVDNRGGGNGNIGTAIAAKATPDGYVLVFASGTTFTINPFVYKSLGFDPKKDFAPVIKFGAAPNVLVVHPSLPARTLAEFTQYAKRRAGRTELRVRGQRQQHASRGRAVSEDDRHEDAACPVRFSGAATRTRSRTARSSYSICCPPSHSRSLAGTCVRWPCSAPRRASVLPDVPTTKEAGMAGLEAGTWYTVLAPAGTPQAVIDMLNRQINASLAEPVFRKRVEDMGVTPMGGTPEDVTSYIASESARWSDVVKSAGIRMD